MQGGAAEMIEAMYRGTKVAGVSDAPKKFLGVFWMKGNAIGEELVVLQHGCARFSPQSRRL